MRSLLFMFILLLIFNIFDTYATAELLRNTNITEFNPFAMYIIKNFGYNGLLYYKLGFILFYLSACLVSLKIRGEYNRRLLIFVTTVYFIVNLYQVSLLVFI